jgi:hypothetical protein
MNKEQVINLMASSKNETDWNNNCDKVKKAYKGLYPDFWYSEIIQSGLIKKILGTGSSEIKFHTF